MSIATIKPKEVFQLGQDGQQVDLIDVRTPAEFQGVHAEGAKNFPLDKLNPKAIMESRNGSAGEPLYLICQMGGRSMKACQQFVAAGYDKVVNVEGGTLLWQSQGLPVVKGEKQVMAIDRQVRITAGSLIVLGVLLAALLPQIWIGLVVAGFVGAGLVFSGVTNTCTMATILSKMPWNNPAGEC